MVGENFGTQLKRAREELNLSLKDVEDVIKIRADFLSAIEDGDLSGISLPDVYRQGFVRTYAEFLHIDSREILSQTGVPESSPKSRKIVQEQIQPPPAATVGEFEDRPQEQPAGDGWVACKAFMATACRAIGQRLRERTWQIGLGCVAAALLACALFWKFNGRYQSNILEDLLDRNAAEMIAIDEIPTRRLTLTASESVQVFMRNKTTREKLFSGTLRKGETRHIDYYDDVQISFSEGNALTIRMEDGGDVRPKKAGAGWLEVRYQN
ncbi:MAG: helix-turn-helix domain-containing protein [Puniceicoccales bacterium]|jgi:transcriptional regulator with XRE-family HTH domain|nr:helix-turn-helix domain-containing protein [Puniceicoccales bacterium]